MQRLFTIILVVFFIHTSIFSNNNFSIITKSDKDILKKIDKLDKTKDIDEIISLYQRLIGKGRNKLIKVNERRFINSRRYYAKSIKELGENAIETYKNKYESLAKEALKKAIRQKNYKLLNEIPMNFPYTQSSFNSLLILYEYSIDKADTILSKWYIKSIKELFKKDIINVPKINIKPPIKTTTAIKPQTNLFISPPFIKKWEVFINRETRKMFPEKIKSFKISFFNNRPYITATDINDIKYVFAVNEPDGKLSKIDPTKITLNNIKDNGEIYNYSISSRADYVIATNKLTEEKEWINMIKLNLKNHIKTAKMMQFLSLIEMLKEATKDILSLKLWTVKNNLKFLVNMWLPLYEESFNITNIFTFNKYTGKLLSKQDINGIPITVKDNVLYLFKIPPQKRAYNFTLEAVNLSDLSVLWKNNKKLRPIGKGTVIKNFLYLPTTTGLSVIDMKTGKFINSYRMKIWEFKNNKYLPTLETKVLITNSVIYFTNKSRISRWEYGK